MVSRVEEAGIWIEGEQKDTERVEGGLDDHGMGRGNSLRTKKCFVKERGASSD